MELYYDSNLSCLVGLYRNEYVTQNATWPDLTSAEPEVL
jgi:hypothetical protein